MKWYATIRVVDGRVGPDETDIQMSYTEEVWRSRHTSDGTKSVFGGRWYRVEVDDEELA